VTNPHHGAGRRTSWSRARLAVLTSSVLLLALATACTSSPAAPSPDTQASAVVQSLGAVPIPSAAATDPTPTATPEAPQLLAMGAATLAALDPGTRATVTATGPDQVVAFAPGGAPAAPAPATITLTAATTTGTVQLDAADLLCRDDRGDVIALTPVGPATTDVPAGTTGAVRATGLFRSGAAQVTWRPHGHTTALWDFTIELD
jgi:hypothetical protein